jgi:CubicO group peptidase (beta-lactamase class C family)
LPRFRHQDIVIWDLLTHTSGLQSDIPRAAKLASREEALDKIFACDPTYPKNSKIVYSDIGFILLGMVVEAVANMPLNEFAKMYIFDPLGMKDTTYNPVDKERCAPTELRQDDIYQGYVRGHVHDEKSYILGGVAGHAGVFSTVNDLQHFMQMILDDGKYAGKQILSKPTIDLLFRKQVEMSTGISLDTDARGLGWIVRGNFCSAGDLVSPNTILHTGFTGTNIFIDRDNKIAFCMLTNRVHPTRDNVKIIPFRAKVGNYILSHFRKEKYNGN